MRGLKLAILFGCVGLMAEGLLELPNLLAPFVAPPSVPGRSKIIEHFALQHVLFPLIGMLLVFSPASLVRLLGSRLTRFYLGILAVLVTVPELLVSFKGELFRPYPFELHSAFLKSLQMVGIGGVQLNTLQLQHLLFSHIALMGAIVALALAPRLLCRFAGPHTGEARIGLHHERTNSGFPLCL